MSEQIIFTADEETLERTFSALIVDDDILNRRIFQLTLQVAGYEISEAENGLYGLNILSEQTFDLLILDLAMPEVDGMTVLRTLRQMPLHEGMRVVVVTANPHLALGEVDDLADFVMYKPIDVIEFRNFVQRLKDDPRANYCPNY